MRLLGVRCGLSAEHVLLVAEANLAVELRELAFVLCQWDGAGFQTLLQLRDEQTESKINRRDERAV